MNKLWQNYIFNLLFGNYVESHLWIKKHYRFWISQAFEENLFVQAEPLSRSKAMLYRFCINDECDWNRLPNS